MMRLPAILFYGFVLFFGVFACSEVNEKKSVEKKPNILFAISDDQSYPYTSVYGASGISTPAFDRVAKSGILFHNAFVAAPQCSPSRAAILTGKNIWQLEEAGTHSSYFPKKFTVFTELLKKSGYKTGYTGKPWGPGNWKDAGWESNPVGPSYNSNSFEEKPNSGISANNYFANFQTFMEERQTEEPFFFWFGGFEPHRPYQFNSGYEAGKKEANVRLPDFLPKDSVTLKDVADYTFEIEWFDSHLGKMLDLLEANGELENTIIIVTADNGMPFPYAKANLQEYGTHVPLTIAWPKAWKAGRETTALASMIDIAPTLLEVVGINLPEMSGKSMLPLLTEDKAYRNYVYTGRERHTHARPDNLGYPARAIRSENYLYIRNFKPDRWPAGNPKPAGREDTEGFRSFGLGYADIDGSPSKSFVFENEGKFPEQYQLAFGKRPAEELFDIKSDPYCINNLASDPAMQEIKERLSKQLNETLLAQKDPRVTGNGDVFESYPRFASMRNFSGFHNRGNYNPTFLPEGQKGDTIQPQKIR